MATALDRAALPRNELLSQWTQHAACADAELDACATELRQARHVQRAWAAGGVVGDAAQRAEHAAQRAEAAECLSAALWSVLEERAKLLGDDDMVDAATSSALDKAHKRATRAWRVLSSLRGLSRAARDVRREVDSDAVPWLNARYKARKRAASVDKGEPLLAFLLQRGGLASDDAHPVADAAWWATLAQDGDSTPSKEVEDASIPTASDDATLDHRLAAACVVSGDVALRRAVLDGSDGVEAVRKGALALQETAAAVFLPPGIVDVAAVCWGLDVADGLASEASDEEGLSAARAAFARAAPLAADLGSRYGDSSPGLRLLLARRIGRLADLDVAAALFALAALADGDDSRFAVARSVAHSNARRPDRALQVLRAADDRADDASLHTARMRVFEALWAQGDRKACAQLPVTFRDEKALAEALAPKARGGDRAAGDCLVAALLRRRRVADAQRLRPFASPRALKALDVAKASHVSAEPLEGRYCPYLAALEQGASTVMADEEPARVDVWPAAPDNDGAEDQVMRERPQQRREDQGGGEDDEASHEGPAHVVAAPFTLPAPPTQPRFSFSLPPAPPSSHSIFDGITGGEEKSSGEVNVTSPVDEGRADARAALEARIRDRVDALRQQEDVAMEEAAPAPAPEPMEEEEAAAAPAPPAPEPMEEEEEEAAAAPEPMETELSDDPIEDSEEDVVAAPAEDNTSLGDDDELGCASIGGRGHFLAMKGAVVALALGATALTTSSNRLPSAPRRTPTTASLKMEDFGLLKGTPFDFGREWTKDGMTEQQKGSIEECMSEATMEKYMNDNGLRFKMNKTAKEREGLKLFGGLLPEFEVNIPILNVDLKVAAPEVESIWEAIGFTATSNNAARVAEKQKAVAKEKKNAEKFGDILAYWKEKYGYSKYYPGSWFYYDQLSTDPDENGRGQINTPANRQMSGFRMRKGGFYLDGTKDTRT